ncbi:SDR family NAD(P)-dependent oxidoreductase [Roseomonas elaeocarpi]|uniref:SDR family NAD(P)-dependent oxidoreductase n=1 Tax=Roseomonas elaeocarpi TaxID=907779 RepID=A0ABV6JTW0_9PROT
MEQHGSAGVAGQVTAGRGEFAGRRVAVMGGSRGIGRAIALCFAREGASVSICARGAGPLEEARQAIAAINGLLGATAHAGVCDLGDAAAIARFVPEAAAALGGLDVLVNNASAFGYTDDEEGWAASLSVDVMAVVRATQAALPFLRAGTGASVVNIASISAYRASSRAAPYGAAKAAVSHYTASQAKILAPERIRANCVAPGSIEFPGGLWEERRLKGEALYDRTLASIPFGRMGQPEEVAEVVCFLASDRARWVTGQTLAVDGGQLVGP